MNITYCDSNDPKSKGFYWKEGDTLYLPTHLKNREEIIEKWKKQIK